VPSPFAPARARRFFCYSGSIRQYQYGRITSLSITFLPHARARVKTRAVESKRRGVLALLTDQTIRRIEEHWKQMP